jgi:hypothetical protein
MQTTLGNLTSLRVAGGRRAEALTWITRRLDWEARLLDLEAAAGTPLAPVARAS